MTFKDWIKQSGRTAYYHTKALGISHSTMWRWLSGRGSPCPTKQKVIAKYTDGKVTPNDWVGVSEQ